MVNSSLIKNAFRLQEANVKPINKKYLPGDKQPPKLNLNEFITIAYDYIKIDSKPFSFNHLDVKKYEINCYFSLMQKISTMTISELSAEGHYKRHFGFIERPDGILLELLENTFPEGLSYTPLIGQIALYPNKKGGKPTDGSLSKAPRIFFIVNEASILHILYLDLYHEIIETAY